MMSRSGQACERSGRVTTGVRVLTPLLLLLWLAACRSLGPPSALSWPERRSALQAVEHFGFNGQLAVATASEGFSASLRWQQDGVASELLLRAPLGVGGARVHFDGARLQLIAADGTRSEGEEAQAQLVKVLGFDPPLTSLRYWLLGVPDPSTTAVESLDPTARLTQLQQGEWQVEYSEYERSGGQWLPRQLLLRRGALRMKLHISQWRFG